jgi:hypothetical protein
MLHSRHPRPVLAWLVRVALAPLALATLLVCAGCGPGPTRTLHATPTVAPTPAPPLAGPHMVATLTGIALLSPTEGWIVGRDGYYHGIGAFLLHYHTGGWRLEAFPELVDAKAATPTSIAMVTADTGWIAVTLAPDDTPIILHERAGGWGIEHLPARAGVVTALSAPTQADAWALSTSVAPTSSTPTSAILHYRAGQWMAEATFPGAALKALSMDAADDGWAVGSDNTGPVLLHYAQGTWVRVAPAALGGVAALTGVFMASPSAGWASGLTPVPASSCTECGGTQPQRVMLRFRAGGGSRCRSSTVGQRICPIRSRRLSSSLLSRWRPVPMVAAGWRAKHSCTLPPMAGRRSSAPPVRPTSWAWRSSPHPLRASGRRGGLSARMASSSTSWAIPSPATTPTARRADTGALCDLLSS